MKDQMVSFAIGYLREAQACEIKLATCLAIVALSFEWENSFDLSKKGIYLLTRAEFFRRLSTCQPVKFGQSGGRTN